MSDAVDPSSAASEVAVAAASPPVEIPSDHLAVPHQQPVESPEDVNSPLSDGSEAHDATPLSPDSTEKKASQMELVHELKRERKKSILMGASTDGWIDVQERTFLRWTNYQLSKKGQKIENLKTGLSDGIALCALIEILSKKPLPSKPKPAKNQVIRLDNLRIAFGFLEKEKGVHLVNVRPSDVEQGNLKIVLGLVWGLIHKYQIMDIGKASTAAPSKASADTSAQADANATVPASSPASTASTPSATSAETNAKNDLLKWVNGQTLGFPCGLVMDFSKSWQDGKVLSALVESMDVSLIHPDPHNKSLPLTGDALQDTTNAVNKAEQLYGIPPLMDAADIVSRPQEHALMTYISLYREWQLTSKDQSKSEPASEKSTPNTSVPTTPTGDATTGSSSAHHLQVPGAAGGEEDMEALTVPLSPLRVIKVLEPDAPKDDDSSVGAAAFPKEDEEVLPAVDHTLSTDAPGTPKQDADEAKKDELGVPQTEVTDTLLLSPERPRAGTHPSLVGAYIDSASLEAAVSPRPVKEEEEHEEEPTGTPTTAFPGESVLPSPQAGGGGEAYDSEKQAEKDALQAPMSIEHVPVPLSSSPQAAPTSAAAASSTSATSSDPEGPKPDLNAVEDYSLDDSAPRPGETQQQAQDRRIEQMMNAIEICVVTPDQKYLQSDSNGLVRAHEVNTVAATWTILDGAGGWKFLRDHQSRYLAADKDGRVYTCQKKPECRWRIIRGGIQYFEDMHGNYLSVQKEGSSCILRTLPTRTVAAQFKICFVVLEGSLQKKGTSGLHRWQTRYFAFNGNVMSYWRKQSSVGKERPSGIYHPSRMLSVNINRSVAKRFNIVFSDGKIVELLAPTVEETVRWVRGLNSRGIRTVQQNRRMSVFPQGQQGGGSSANLSAQQQQGRPASVSVGGAPSSAAAPPIPQRPTSMSNIKE